MYQRILVPVDGSVASILALDEAIRVAALTGAQLSLIHVADEHSLALAMEDCADRSGDWLAIVREGGQHILDAARNTASAAGVAAQACILDSHGRRASALILAQARRWSADLIVMGLHGRRPERRWHFGSSALAVAREAPVPVLFVPDEKLPEPGDRLAGNTIASGNP